MKASLKRWVLRACLNEGRVGSHRLAGDCQLASELRAGATGRQTKQTNPDRQSGVKLASVPARTVGQAELSSASSPSLRFAVYWLQDDDRCEEWERHEALHEDVTSQERCKERLFEEEIELKWEKGGSGLVFYTDAQYWQEEEGGMQKYTIHMNRFKSTII